MMEDPDLLTRGMKQDVIECVVVDDLNTYLDIPLTVERRRAAAAREVSGRLFKGTPLDLTRAPKPAGPGTAPRPAARADRLDTPEKVARLYEQYGLDPADRSRQSEDVARRTRQEVFPVLGRIANRREVVPVWVLSGKSAQFRRRWLETIADILSVDEHEAEAGETPKVVTTRDVRVIELADRRD